MSINAGRLRQLAIIEQATEVKGAMGGTSKTWSTFANVRCDLIHASGRELMASGQQVAEVKARAFIRYTAGITPKMRLNVEGIVYDIEAVLDRDGRKQVQELILAQGVNDG